MAVNLIDSTDIQITQTGDNIELNTSTSMASLLSSISNNTTKIANITGTILWTNDNISSITSDKTITLSSSDYDVLEVYYQQTASDTRSYCQKILKGTSGRLSLPVLSSGNVAMAYRNFNRNTDTSYTITTITGAGGNDYIIPIYVIGYKTGLFS